MVADCVVIVLKFGNSVFLRLEKKRKERAYFWRNASRTDMMHDVDLKEYSRYVLLYNFDACIKSKSIL